MQKAKLQEPVPPKQLPKVDVEFFSSGSTLLDLALGGGWALSRVFNIVGDKSTGKTLLAIEAYANFKRAYPNGKMRYAEAESAFDDSFADQLGFPPEVERPEKMIHTVEEFTEDVYKFIDLEDSTPSLYILDSLDSISTDSEVERFDKIMEGKEAGGSFGAEKAKAMSGMFKNIVQDVNKSKCAVGIISQVRDNIGVTFGERHTRSGGRALDFYASQVLYLAQVGMVTKTSKGQLRAIGVSIHSKVKKCKVGYPFREADYDIIFGYGIDDELSMLDWLTESKALAKESAEEIKKTLIKAREKQDYASISEIHGQLKADTKNIWNEIERNLAPPIRKYGNQAPPTAVG